MSLFESFTANGKVIGALVLSSALLMGCEFGVSTPATNTNPDNTNPDNTNPDNTNPDNTDPDNTNPDNKPESPFAEVWYLTESKNYMAFADDSSFEVYKCTINNGYVVDDQFSGKLSGNQLTVDYNNGDQDTYTVGNGAFTVNNDVTVQFHILDDVPADCNEDMIEITNVSRTVANANQAQEFVLDIDYRLTKNAAVIEAGFTVESNGNYKAYTSDSYTVRSSGTDSIRLTLNHTPTDLGNGVLYAVHVNLSPAVDSRDTDYEPYSTDYELITIR